MMSSKFHKYFKVFALHEFLVKTFPQLHQLLENITKPASRTKFLVCFGSEKSLIISQSNLTNAVPFFHIKLVVFVAIDSLKKCNIDSFSLTLDVVKTSPISRIYSNVVYTIFPYIHNVDSRI